MHAMDLTKAIELLEKSEHVGIFLMRDASFDSLAAAEVLARTLSTQGKKVGLLGERDKNAAAGKSFFRMLASSSGLPKEFVISINTDVSPISQLRYEKSESGIDIVLSPKSSAVAKESLSFRDGKIICDCAIAIGVAEIDMLSGLPGLEPEFFTQVPIVNIDTAERNKNYGEINLVAPGKNSASEIVYELLSALKGSPPDEDTANLILAGIISETGGFRSQSTTPDALLAASELARCGAQPHIAFSMVGDQIPLNVLQLAGRASVRSRLDEDRGVLWSFITAEDFEKTGTGSADISKVLSRLDASFPVHRLTAALWQDQLDKTVHTTISGEKPILEEIRERNGGEFRSPHLELSRTHPSFREAEDALTTLFKEFIRAPEDHGFTRT